MSKETVPITEPGVLQKIFAAFQTDSSYAAHVPTTTEPTDGALNDNHKGSVLHIHPIGVGADNVTFKVLVVGWNKVVIDADTTLWMPTEIIELTCTCGTATYTDPDSVVWRFADTIVPTASGGLEGSNFEQNITVVVGLVASIIVDGLGFEKVTFHTDKNASATSVNVLAGKF